MTDLNKIANRIAEALKDRAIVVAETSFAIGGHSEAEFDCVFVEFKNEFDNVDDFDSVCAAAIGKDVARVVSTYELSDSETFDVGFVGKVDGSVEANYYTLK